MTRAWAPSIKSIQDAIVAAIVAERDANAGSLPSYMQGEDFAIVAAIGSQQEEALPNSIRVLPPENSLVTADVTNALEATLEFPAILKVKSLDREGALTALREAQGLVLDAINTDPTLTGRCAGYADPAFRFSNLEVDGGEARQEVAIRLMARN